MTTTTYYQTNTCAACLVAITIAQLVHGHIDDWVRPILLVGVSPSETM